MAGFVDVLLRGAILVLASLVLGGVVWTRLILRAGRARRRRGRPRWPCASSPLRRGAWPRWPRRATLLVALAELARPRAAGRSPSSSRPRSRPPRSRASRSASRSGYWRCGWRDDAAGSLAWHALGAGAVALVAASAVLSHAVARVEGRALLLLLDATHQLAAAVWIGGLAHLVLYAGWASGRRPRSVGAGAATRVGERRSGRLVLRQEVAGTDGD